MPAARQTSVKRSDSGAKAGLSAGTWMMPVTSCGSENYFENSTISLQWMVCSTELIDVYAVKKSSSRPEGSLIFACRMPRCCFQRSANISMLK